MLQAMQRDLGLDARQAARYLEVERSATARLPEARRSLGTAYAGSWIEHGKDGRFRLVIATTDAASAERARGFGAEARVFKRSLAQLESAKQELDRLGRQRKPDSGIHTWYIDLKTNQVVIEADHEARDAALDFAALSDIDAAAVRFRESRGVPQTTQIVGGERYNVPGDSCSIGFPVTRGTETGFVTAGHCGTAGTTTTGTNGVAQGTFVASNFPGADMGWVRITNTASWPLRNWVTDYAGGNVPIFGSTVVPVGSMVCRSGATTGYRCGTITATNVTVNYSQGTVFGLTSSSACAGRGDSGGSFITPAGQAQGVTSGGQFPFGGNNNCTSNPPVTFYQPLQPLLNQYGLTLFTSPSVSGMVTTAAGVAVRGVSISNGSTTVTTDAEGRYVFGGVANGTYTLTATLNGYSFTPFSRTVNVSNANIQDQDFIATGDITIQRWNCPIYLDPERTHFYCEVFYTSASSAPPTVNWMGGGFDATSYVGNGDSWYQVPYCAPGERRRITVTVSSGAHSVSRSSLFNCGTSGDR
jgi:streptogrisin C